VMATDAISMEEVVRAGHVLFGPGFAADQAWWRDALRATYRRRALETHPDRARSLGRSESDLAREFQAIAEAYRVLSQMRAGPMSSSAGDGPWNARHAARPAGGARAAHRAAASAGSAGPGPTPRPPTSRRADSSVPGAGSSVPGAGSSVPGAGPSVPGAGPAAARPDPAAPRARAGVRPDDLPRRRLRFAEFLYYTGRVPWTTFVDAIAWQRSQRPALGRIAVEYGFLRPEAVAEVLERRRLDAAQSIPFGEYALRSGYVTSFQLLAMLGQQLRLQRPIGQFFVERGHIEEGDVDEIRGRLMRHNVRF